MIRLKHCILENSKQGTSPDAKSLSKIWPPLTFQITVDQSLGRNIARQSETIRVYVIPINNCQRSIWELPSLS